MAPSLTWGVSRLLVPDAARYHSRNLSVYVVDATLRDMRWA
jgi:hypothetical protein